MPDCPPGRPDLPQHRNGVLGYGSRLPRVGRQGAKVGASVLEDLRRVPVDPRHGRRNRDRHARRDAIWVRWSSLVSAHSVEKLTDRKVGIRRTTGSCRGVRPFGVSLLVAGFDNAKGHTLYQVDPSGSFWAWKASAIGKNQVNAKTFLEKRYILPPSTPFQPLVPVSLTSCSFRMMPLLRYNDDLSLEDAIHTALLTLKEGFEGVMDEKTIELGIISTQPTDEAFKTTGHGTGLKGSPGFRKLTEQEVAE